MVILFAGTGLPCCRREFTFTPQLMANAREYPNSCAGATEGPLWSPQAYFPTGGRRRLPGPSGVEIRGVLCGVGGQFLDVSMSADRWPNSSAGAALRRFRVGGGNSPSGLWRGSAWLSERFSGIACFPSVLRGYLLCFASCLLVLPAFSIFARDEILLGLLLIFGGSGRGYPVMGCPPCGAAAGPSGRHGVFLVFAKSRWIVLVDTP